MSVYATDFIRYSYSVYVTTQQTSPVDEVACRTIINRAYYGAFLAAREYADITGKNNAHQRVLHYFKSIEHRTISDELKELKELRQAADYILGLDISIQHAKASCAQAARIVKLINALPPRPSSQPQY